MLYPFNRQFFYWNGNSCVTGITAFDHPGLLEHCARTTSPLGMHCGVPLNVYRGVSGETPANCIRTGCSWQSIVYADAKEIVLFRTMLVWQHVCRPACRNVAMGIIQIVRDCWFDTMVGLYMWQCNCQFQLRFRERLGAVVMVRRVSLHVQLNCLKGHMQRKVQLFKFWYLSIWTYLNKSSKVQTITLEKYAMKRTC